MGQSFPGFLENMAYNFLLTYWRLVLKLLELGKSELPQRVENSDSPTSNAIFIAIDAINNFIFTSHQLKLLCAFLFHPFLYESIPTLLVKFEGFSYYNMLPKSLFQYPFDIPSPEELFWGFGWGET